MSSTNRLGVARYEPIPAAPSTPPDWTQAPSSLRDWYSQVGAARKECERLISGESTLQICLFLEGAAMRHRNGIRGTTAPTTEQWWTIRSSICDALRVIVMIQSCVVLMVQSCDVVMVQSCSVLMFKDLRCFDCSELHCANDSKLRFCDDSELHCSDDSESHSSNNLDLSCCDVSELRFAAFWELQCAARKEQTWSDLILPMIRVILISLIWSDLALDQSDSDLIWSCTWSEWI